MNTYCLQLRGRVDLPELNTLSPHQMNAVRSTPEVTWVQICTDQSGMIGLLRHLNNLGLVILSVECQAGPGPSGPERNQP